MNAHAAAFVKGDGGVVKAPDVQFDARAGLLAREGFGMRHQRPADAVAAACRVHIQIVNPQRPVGESGRMRLVCVDLAEQIARTAPLRAAGNEDALVRRGREAV